MIPGAEPVSEADEQFVFQDTSPSNSKFEFENGVYPGQIVSLTPNISKKGNPQFVVQLVGTGGAAKGLKYKFFAPRNWMPNDPGYTPENVNPDATWKFDKVLDAVGVPKAAKGQPRPFKTSDVVLKEVGMKLEKETRQSDGKVFMNCSRILPLTAVAQAPAGSSDIPF